MPRLESGVSSGQAGNPPKLGRPRIREKGGSIGSGRHGFHHDWALLELIERYRCGGTFCIGLEWHDDVVVADDALNPSRFEFFQIKTKEYDKWTVSSLLYAEKGKDGNRKRSIMAKMALNLVAFPEHCYSVSFVSNMALKVLDQEGDAFPSVFSFADLPGGEQAKVTKHLGDSLSINPELSRFHFRITDLSVRGHEAHAKGVLAEFLEEYYPGALSAVSPVYRVIISEILRCANSEETLKEFRQAVVKKFITKDKFQEMLSQFIPSLNPREMIELICQGLLAAHWDTLAVARLKPYFDTYLIRIQDSSDLAFISLLGEIRKIIMSMDLFNSLIEAEEMVRGRIVSAYPCNPLLIQAAIFMEICLYESQRELPQIAPEPEGKIL